MLKTLAYIKVNLFRKPKLKNKIEMWGVKMKYLRNGYVGMFVTALLIVILVACGNTQAEREVYEAAIDDIMEAAGLPPIFAEQDDNDSDSADGGEQAVAEINLQLPITVQNRTFFVSRMGAWRITTDGVLQSASLNPIGGGIADDWENIDTDVRAFEVANAGGFPAIFHIKNDNSLWAVGRNTNGLLGDGTGMDQDKPVRILDNAADVVVSDWYMFALLTDGTLWYWGSGTFEPAFVKDNVAKLAQPSGILLPIQTNAGNNYLYNMQIHGFQRVGWGPVLAIENIHWNGRYRLAYINHENTLIFGDDEIADNVERLFSYGWLRDMLFIKSDGSLWGIGQNANGELGDSTRVPRNVPVHIADNVIEVGYYQFITADGTLYTWDADNPTPQPTLENVAALGDGYLRHLDGSVVRFVHLLDGCVVFGEQVIENVLIPSIRTFD